MKKRELRDPRVVMNIKRLGAMHQSRISFARTLLRNMYNNKWSISKNIWNLDKNGYGTAIYKILTPNSTYNFVIFSKNIKDEERNDRVIAQKWDTTFTLIKGEVDDELFDMLKSNVPLQEAGRNSNRGIVIGRANKSVRMFEHVLDAISNGRQPDLNELSKVGYILRTTAVYGSGKFGVDDFDNIKKNPDFYRSFSAEMCAVYIIRQFSIDLVHYIAKNRGGDKAITLNKNTQRYLGIGNATGLGMALFLIRHPKIINNWFYQKEMAFSEVLQEKVTNSKSLELLLYINRAIKHLRSIVTINEDQDLKNHKAANELQLIIKIIDNNMDNNSIYNDIYSKASIYSFEAQECLASSIIELFPDLVDKYGDEMNSSEKFLGLSGVTIKELKKLLIDRYSWATNIDFSKDEHNYWFWYLSKDKEEPRFGIRNIDVGSELELPLDIARQINRLNIKLKEVDDDSDTIAKFLLTNSEYSAIVRRVWTMGHCNMGEIQANTIDKEFLPLDLLRAKLSMFGATKFDPRSNKWVQITLYQGAPLIDEIHPNEWMFPLLPSDLDSGKSDESGLILSKNELHSLCMKSYNGLRINSGDFNIISKMIIELEMVGLNGIEHYLKAIEYINDNTNTPKIKVKSNDDKIVLDLNSSSLLIHIQTIINYAIEKLEDTEIVNIQILNCRNRWLTFSQMQRLSHKGYSAIFKWDNPDQTNIEYNINANEEFPTVIITKGITNIKNNMLIKISKNNLDNKKTINDNTTYILPKELEKCYKRSNKKGIFIKMTQWKELKLFAGKSLVEDSIQSSENAGGIVSK